MEIINFNSPIFNITNKIEHEIFINKKKIPDFLFKIPFEKYYFLWDSMSFNTLKLFQEVVLPLLNNGLCKEAILTSLLPHSNGKELLKFKLDNSDSAEIFNQTMRYDPISTNESHNIMYSTQAPAIYSMDKSWAIVGDSWDTDITVLAINSELKQFLPINDFCTIETIEKLLFFVQDENVKTNLLKQIKKNWT